MKKNNRRIKKIKIRIVAGEGSRGRSGVDEQLVLILIRLKLVRMPSHKNIHIQLPLQGRQRLVVAPRHNLMPVAQTESERPKLNHLRVRKVPARLHIRPHETTWQ